MTLESLIVDLNNETLNLEEKINSLINFYYKSYSQDHKLSIVSLHDNSQIDLLHLAQQILENKDPKKLKNIAEFEQTFFNIIVLVKNLDFTKFVDITFKFDEIFDKDSLRFHHLKKIGQKDTDYAQYLFSLITNNLEKHYDHLGLAVACLTNFEPNKTQEFILKQFDLKEKNIDLLLNAIGYMVYPLPSDALQILDKIVQLIDQNTLNGDQFSKILEVITYMYLQHEELEVDIIKTLEIIENKTHLVDISVQTANLLFFQKANLSKEIKEIFYRIIMNADKISPPVCEHISLTIDHQTNDDDLKQLIEVIEHLIVKHENISIHNFHTYQISENPDFLNKLITRWLFSKKVKLQESVSTLISIHQIKLVNADISWTTNFKEEDYIFLTKKVIGWFYIYENLILHFITSLLNQMKNLQLIDQVLELTFQHVIINYNPQHIGFFFDSKNYLSSEVQEKIQEFKIQHENFYSNIDQAKHLKELACPLEHSRLLQYKRYHENEKINKSADAQSAFADLFTKKVMLYGETHIHIANIGSDELSLQESELSSFSYTMTLPLQYFTDPILLEYQKQVMKYEEMEA